MPDATTLETEAVSAEAEVVEHVDPAATTPDAGSSGPLFAAEETARLRSRWSEVQATFVDEPRTSVQAADALVAETMQRLSEIFAGERANLEGAWSRGDEASTEDLRQAIRRYRSFFDRLLSV